MHVLSQGLTPTCLYDAVNFDGKKINLRVITVKKYLELNAIETTLTNSVNMLINKHGN